MVPLPEPAPARFWMRYAAWSLDAVCLLPWIALLGAAPLQRAMSEALASFRQLSASMGQLMESALAQGQTPLAMALASLSDPHLLADIDRLESALFTLLLLPPALYALLACVYSLGFERSHWQATPGKRVLGLQVVRVDGGAMTLGTAMQRFLAAGLSWISLNLGHALAAFAPYLALHDRLSRTRVLADSPGLPAWAKAWLWAQLAAGLFACLWLFSWMQSAMQAALDSALDGM